MPFDRRSYFSGSPIRRAVYYPRNLHIGSVLSNALRNSYVHARMYGRGLGAHAWPREMIEPWRIWSDTSEYIIGNLYKKAYEHHAYVGEHYTHVVAHVAFTVPNPEAQKARLKLIATLGGSTGNTVVDVELGPDSGSRFAEGSLAPLEARGGSYEGIVEVPLATFPLADWVRFELLAYAFQVNEEAMEVGHSMRVDSVSLWLESRN